MSQKIRVLGLLGLTAFGVTFFPDIIKLGDVAFGFVVGALLTSVILLVMKLTKFI